MPLNAETGRKKVFAVASGGGHWIQLLRLAPAFEDSEVVFGGVSESYRSQVGKCKFYMVTDATRWDKIGLIKSALKLAWIIWKEKPDVVISTGAAPGYLAIRLGKLFGAKTIWLDSIANVESLSMSGAMAGRHTDLWLTQWPALEKPEGPYYRGSVLCREDVPARPAMEEAFPLNARTRRKKLLAVASGGGHWIELLRLTPAFTDSEVVFVGVRNSNRSQVAKHKFYSVGDATRWDRLQLIKLAFKLAWIIWKEKPDVVISTGAAPGYLAIRLGKLFGAKTIWLDSMANVESLSMSGEMAGRHADLWLTQWPGLEKSEGPYYRGSVL